MRFFALCWVAVSLPLLAQRLPSGGAEPPLDSGSLFDDGTSVNGNPGGLGFVEAGLTGLLTAAGVGAQKALVSTLAYRLVAFWFPIPAGGVAQVLFRRRYGSVPESDSELEPESGAELSDSSTSKTVP